MKNIIIPTDYSSNARNAAEYGLLLAKVLGASVEFLHVFSEPVHVPEFPVASSSIAEMTKKEKAKLSKEAKIYSRNFGITVKATVYPGELHEVLNKMMYKRAEELVVMGMKGTSVIGRISLGNTTTKMIRQAHFPLLIVPSQTKFKHIRNIALAADYNAFLDVHSLAVLKDIAKAFDGKIQAVHIEQPEEELAEIIEKSESERYFHKLFEGLKISYTSLESENTLNGLSQFVRDRNAGLIVMIPQKKNIWQSLFMGSNTKKMAYQTDIPLLVLPSSEK